MQVCVKQASGSAAYDEVTGKSRRAAAVAGYPCAPGYQSIAGIGKEQPMRFSQIQAVQSLRRSLLLVLGLAIFVAGLLFGVGAMRAFATHGGSGDIHACVSVQSNKARIMLPGQAPNCRSGEMLVEWPSSAVTADLESRVAALETQLAALDAQVPDCLAEEAGDAVFTGCDVEIRNGLGSTETSNGTGNLIVGYNENSFSFTRTGSHNIVVGKDHGYSSYGGMVVGIQNIISGEFASVSGGVSNEASGNWSSVSGGFFNTASGERSSVSGGGFNTASGERSSVSGGDDNTASGLSSSVSGGDDNTASGERSSVSGGSNNEASGDWSSVSGGRFNKASGAVASVSGGSNNEASGVDASVSGGFNRTAEGPVDWVAGALFQDF